MKQGKTNEKVVVVEDDDEDIESVKGPARSSPFHLLGAFCFIMALIMAVVCCLVSTLIGGITSTVRGYIFFATFATFILLLFFCLCCTYYLGASRDAWETPTFTGVRWNFTNIIAMVGLFVEFVQICSFSFNESFGPYLGSYIFRYFNYVATPYPSGSAFEYAYWTMFVIAFSPYIFVIAIRILIYMYGIRRGEDSAAGVVERYQDNIYSVLWFLVNTLYFPVITMMLTGTSCTFEGKSRPLLDANNDIVCLQGRHIGFLVCTIIALIIYYPAASFAQSQTQNISDIKFKPKVVFVMLQGKFLMGAVCVSFGRSRYSIYLLTVVIINFFFLALNVVFQPCLLPWVNRLRTIFFSLSFWASIVLVIANRHYYNGNKVDKTWYLPLLLLLVGWAVIITFLILFFAGYAKLIPFIKRWAPGKHQDNEQEKDSRESDQSREMEEIPVENISTSPKRHINNNKHHSNPPQQQPQPLNQQPQDSSSSSNYNNNNNNSSNTNNTITEPKLSASQEIDINES